AVAPRRVRGARAAPLPLLPPARVLPRRSAPRDRDRLHRRHEGARAGRGRGGRLLDAGVPARARVRGGGPLRSGGVRRGTDPRGGAPREGGPAGASRLRRGPSRVSLDPAGGQGRAARRRVFGRVGRGFGPVTFGDSTPA